MNEQVRLAKYFTDCGVLSRRAAEEEIKKGRVKINGTVAELGQKITPGVDVVEYGGKRIMPSRQSGKVYIMLHKPRGFVTTMSDEKGRPTVAELVRSGINAVDKGQMEAARSLGMSKWQAMRTIVFPQAVKNILPAIGNECIALLKETSVAGYVTVVDLTRALNLIRTNTGDAINPLILLALMYLAMVMIMTKLLSILEKRLRKSEKH